VLIHGAFSDRQQFYKKGITQVELAGLFCFTYRAFADAEDESGIG